MKKFNKVLNIVLILLLVSLCITFCVFYLVDKTKATDFINWLIDILNRPLPIVGVTTLAVLVFAWKIIITTNYGKSKIALYDKKLEEIENAKKDLENEKERAICELKTENQVLRQQLANVCALSTNKKIKDYGKELIEYGEETTNCDTAKE